MGRLYICVAVALIAVLVSTPYVAYTKAVKTYYLAPGDAVVLHRYGLTFNGSNYLVLSMLEGPVGFIIAPNVSVCIRIFTNQSYDSVQPVVDHGDPYSGVNWRVEAVQPTNYRFTLFTGNGNVSVDVPGELYRPRMYCFVVTYSNGYGVINAYTDGKLVNSVSFSGSVNNVLAPITVGGYANGTVGRGFTITQLLIYRRVLNESEIAGIANYVVPYDGLLAFFDPTVYFMEYYTNIPLYSNLADKSGYTIFMYSGGDRRELPIFIDNTTFTVVRSLYNDSYVHFRYFPWYSRVEIYDLSGNIVEKFVVQGYDNNYGQVLDYQVQLSPGEYLIVFYDPNENITVTVTTSVVHAMPYPYTVTETVTTAVYPAGPAVDIYMVLIVVVVLIAVAVYIYIYRRR